MILFKKGIRFVSLIALCSGFWACSSEEDETTANFTLNGAGSGSSSLLANTTPAAASLSVYQFAVSTSTDCSEPLVVIDNGDTAQEFDMVAGPKIGTGTIPDGTYPCVIMVMAPTLTSTAPASDPESPCEASASISQNVCGGNGDSYTVDLDGTAGTCALATDKAYLYLSTGSTNTDVNCESEPSATRSCNSWEPPTTENTIRGVPLGSALVVSGSKISTFSLSDLYVGNDGGDENPSCGMRRPTFTFE